MKRKLYEIKVDNDGVVDMNGTKEKIKTMQAYLDGKVILFRWVGDVDWNILPSDTDPLWEWHNIEYIIGK